MRTIALIALTGLLPSPAFAQSLDARAAQAIVAGCAAHATAKQQSHAIAVVDLGGNLVAALRMASWGFSTAQMEENAKGTPGFANAPHVVTVAGGVPVWSADGKARIGGVGASGEAPADDAACAEAGIRAAGLRSSRTR